MSASPAAASSESFHGVTPSAAGTDRGVFEEACPLCGASLRPNQDWCLRCGAAARTRLAAPPRWKGLMIGLTTVAALALAVLIVALVKIAG